MIAYVSHIGKTSEHTTEIVSQTTDTVRTVFDVLVLICSRIVQLDGIGHIECTVQVEVVLMVVGVELHRLHIVVGV